MTAPQTQPRLAAGLAEALATVRVDEAGTTARVGEREVTADSARDLRRELGSVLYEEWHAGIDRRDGSRRGPHRDRPYEQRLIAATPHTTSTAKAVVRSEPRPGPAGEVVLAEIDRVRVDLPLSALPAGPVPAVGTAVEVALPAVRPALSPGFLLLDGPFGHSVHRQDVLRVYLHVEDADAAPLLWNTTLTQLAARSVRYRAKVISRPWSFPRRDAIVVYLGAEDTDEAVLLAEAVRALPGLGRATSRFVRALAPGVAVAWEPRDARTGWDRMSFGQHRAAAVAHGVMRGAAGGDLTDLVARALLDARVDPADPAMNVDSPALPSPTRTPSPIPA
ncbi:MULTISPECIES: T3SS effector HopA1 family protein [unclassified Streptomyces]|uniref:T3SS effector HopA1 family protein n=1 Tax=unclassified Streptomyces TaxID=2593676 RepID=UPI002E28B786|nr:T3SS effector HopA1 family protein [Streptomyces sp. NBC_00223]